MRKVSTTKSNGSPLVETRTLTRTSIVKSVKSPGKDSKKQRQVSISLALAKKTEPSLVELKADKKSLQEIKSLANPP